MTIPFVEARWYTKVDEGQDRDIWLVVIHDMEAFENVKTAENCANYMKTTDRKVSSHLCCDSDSTVRCVQDRDVAYACVDANRHGLQLEMAGFASQNRSQWNDEYSQAMLTTQVAPHVADWCQTYSLPVRFLSANMIISARRKNVPYKGITTHLEHNLAMRVLTGKTNSYTHTDPGPNFPMANFLGMVNGIIVPPTPVPPQPIPPTPTPEIVLKDMPCVQLGSKGTPVLTLQTMLILRGFMQDKTANKDGVFGNGTDQAVRTYQSSHDLAVDGKVWEQTWARLGYK